MVRIVLLDLLVERAEFGHGGNLEALAPFAVSGQQIECLLLTPQMQAPGARTDGCVALTEVDVPRWDDEYPFWSEKIEHLPEGRVHLRRICMPTTSTFSELCVDAIICSGSRRNVSMWEPWMDGCAELLRWGVEQDIPTLGICFGHQLLAAALGGEVTRAERYTDIVSDLEHHASDPVAGTCNVGLFTHQDHVTALPSGVTHLASAGHCGYAAFKVDHRRAWGVQFHPEAARARIERSFRLGHINEDELAAFQRDHDGAALLSAFAEQVKSSINVE
ncbi:MAG: type 1 glutamine amidotransferase [Candidatus Thalassarchaeaceae archaeon]|nr:type 1 glutamine amidotransferase [Candidatus Thalassarchaeaceae archaeon]